MWKRPRDLFTDPEDDPESALISQRAEAVRGYLELLAERLWRLEGIGKGPALDGNGQLTEYRGLIRPEWIYEVGGARDPRW